MAYTREVRVVFNDDEVLKIKVSDDWDVSYKDDMAWFYVNSGTDAGDYVLIDGSKIKYIGAADMLPEYVIHDDQFTHNYQTVTVNDIIDTIEEEIGKSYGDEYVCKDGTHVDTNIDSISAWFDVYKKVLRKRYGIE